MTKVKSLLADETDEEAKAFESQISGLIMQNAQDAPRTFPDFIRGLPGIWPGTVVKCLQDIAGKYVHLGPTLRLLLDDAHLTNRLFSKGQGLFYSAMPIEHPLDFEWRFAPEAIERLWKEFGPITQIPTGSPIPDPPQLPYENADVVLLGSPTLLWSAFQKGLAHWCLLLDSNEHIVRWFAQNGIPHAIHCTVGCMPPMSQGAHFIVLDPPWYQSHYSTFLWDARNMCALGAKVVVSLPPVGTRPGISREREELFRIAESMGFEVEALDAGSLPYHAPFFEANALSAAGLQGVPADWRTGDLLALRVKGSNLLPRPEALPASSWPEVQLRGVRWRVDTNSSNYVRHAIRGHELLESNARTDLLTLKSLIPGDILPTVSTKDPRRNLANVWTSGNRIFWCDRPDELLLILRELQAKEISSYRDGEPPKLLENAKYCRIPAVAHRVAEITLNELADMQRLGYV